MMMVEERAVPNADPCHPDSSLFAEAERELSAFLSAIETVRGRQCVTAAARQWISALEDLCPSAFASKECFRKVSMAAAVSLSL